jgi:hypothetical protein
MTTIVGCSKSKVSTETPVPAKHLYDSPYFNKRWTVASHDDDHVLILSAKHGIVDPDTKLLPYDVSMYDLSVDERRAMAHDIDTDGWDDTVVVYAGTLYVDVIRDACGSRHTVVSPLSGGLGEQLSQLNTRISEIEEY